MALELVDLADDPSEADLAAWYEVYALGARYGRPTRANPWTPEAVRAALGEHEDARRVATIARLDGVDVGVGLLALPLLDNRTMADVMVLMVLPEHRRAGVGAALLAHQEELAAAAERTVLVAAAHEGPGEGGEDLGGLAFARAHGFEIALIGAQSRLELPVDAGLLDGLADAAAAHHGAYELRTFVGAVPDDIVASYARLDALVETEAPTGELDLEPLQADVATWRAKEADLAAAGRTRLASAALAADGEVVALTEILAADDPATLHQEGTIVRRDHRGHRLGSAVKVANLRRAQEHWPSAHRVVTWNAESNRHMLAVNTEMGFAVVERSMDLQKRI